MKELKIYQLNKSDIDTLDPENFEIEAGAQVWILDHETEGIKPVNVVEVLKETEGYFYILTEGEA